MKEKMEPIIAPSFSDLAQEKKDALNKVFGCMGISMEDLKTIVKCPGTMFPYNFDLKESDILDSFSDKQKSEMNFIIDTDAGVHFIPRR